MLNNELYKRLRYENEVLWAMLEIRDHYLTKVSQEVCEQISQVLYVVRVQLSRLSLGSNSSGVDLEESGELVGKTIRDLRHAREKTSQEMELLEQVGLIGTLSYELNLFDGRKNQREVRVTGEPFDLNRGTELIVLRILQEILLSVQEPAERNSIAIQATYKTGQVLFEISYKGAPHALQWKPGKAAETAGLSRLTWTQRAEVLGGSLRVRTDKMHRTRITLAIPEKTEQYGK